MQVIRSANSSSRGEYTGSFPEGEKVHELFNSLCMGEDPSPRTAEELDVASDNKERARKALSQFPALLFVANECYKRDFELVSEALKHSPGVIFTVACLPNSPLESWFKAQATRQILVERLNGQCNSISLQEVCKVSSTARALFERGELKPKPSTEAGPVLGHANSSNDADASQS